MSGPGLTKSLRGYIVLSLAWLTITGIVYLFARRPTPPPVQILPAATPSPSATGAATPALAPLATAVPLRVDVAGAVQAPGVYRLPANSIVADAIAAAGGPVADADLDRLNKASLLRDGIQVYVPRKAELITPSMVAPGLPDESRGATTNLLGAGGAVDLNLATAEELDKLPGIGPSLAGSIIAGRPYGKVEDLLRVPGIGEGILAKLRPYVKVE
jgi:competence protein ComEA